MAESPAQQTAALITGAGGGIGQALCAAFADAGYLVVATDLADKSPLPYAYLPLDLAALPGDARRQLELAQRLDEVLADVPLGVCVNNAAVQILGGLHQVRDEDFEQTFRVNVFAPLVLARLLLPRLQAAGGSIINIGSIHARATKPGFVSYATSKAALLGLTQALAVDLGPRVRVNAIQPAAVATDMLKAGFDDNPAGYAQLAAYHPMQRIAEPAEIGRLAVMLATAQLPFLSGAAIDIHGGIGCRLHDPD